nr:hypothetical protein CFP56_73591 [Quercus suber]
MISATLTPAAIKTLQRSHVFHSLFNQLGLTPEARTAATEAIVGIASSSGSHCFIAEAHASRAFLEMTNTVTFTDEDMEVQYPNHKRPLYVPAMINEVHVRRALMDTGSSLNIPPLSTLIVAGISQKKYKNFQWRLPDSGEDANIPLDIFRRPWLHKHKLISSTYHQCVKGCLNGKLIRIPANPTPFDKSEAHYLKAAFYDQLTINGGDAIPKPVGTPLPSWEDVKEGSEVDLRDLLERKKKRKERKETTHDAPRCEKFQLPDGRIVYRL